MGALETLLGRARGPMGPPVEVDFGRPEPAWTELAAALTASNGFFACNAGVQVFRVGDDGWGPDLSAWNVKETWKDAYQGLADDVFCFGQDLFGTQFAIDGTQQIVTVDAETGDRAVLGSDLESWAAWILADPDGHGAAGLARAWQDANGPLEPDQRLIPRQFFVTGGSYDFDNLKVVDAVTAMRIRGPIARQVHDLPDGAQLRISVKE